MGTAAACSTKRSDGTRRVAVVLTSKCIRYAVTTLVVPEIVRVVVSEVVETMVGS